MWTGTCTVKSELMEEMRKNKDKVGIQDKYKTLHKVQRKIKVAKEARRWNNQKKI